MSVYATSLNHFKDLFSYTTACKKAFDVSSTIHMKHHAAGSHRTFGHYHFTVALLGILAYRTGGALKGRILGNFIFCRNFWYFSCAAWLVANSHVITSLSIALPFHWAIKSAVFSQCIKHLFIDTLPCEDVFIPQGHAEISFGASCVGDSSSTGLLWIALTSWTPERFHHLFFIIKVMIFGHFRKLCFAARLVTKCNVVPSLFAAYPFLESNSSRAVLGHQFTHLPVDAFPNENVLILHCHTKVCLGASCLCQVGITWFLGGALTGWAPKWVGFVYGSRCFSSAAWLFAPGQVVWLISSPAFPRHVANIGTIFRKHIEHLSVNTFPGKHVFVPDCHAKGRFGASCVCRAAITGFLCGSLTCWTPEIACCSFPFKNKKRKLMRAFCFGWLLQEFSISLLLILHQIDSLSVMTMRLHWRLLHQIRKYSCTTGIHETSIF